MTKETIPVIDISSISLNKENLKCEQFSEVSYHLAQALSTWGFAYLKNHGIPKQTVSGKTLLPVYSPFTFSIGFFDTEGEAQKIALAKKVTISKKIYNFCSILMKLGQIDYLES